MVPFLAFSLQDQVEKYGAYIGIAAFFGLAVLSILYFAQARELRRLRDWAGRAPERAQEIEARAIAQAEAARRVPAQPRPAPAAPPARATAGAPATAAAAGSAAASAEQAGQSTQVVEPPAGAGAAGNGTAADASQAAEPDPEAPGEGASPEAPKAGEAEPKPGDDDAKPVEAEAQAANGQAKPAEAEAQPADADAKPAEGEAQPERPAAIAAGAGSREEEPGEADEPEPEPAAEIPVAPVPRATPLPRRSPAPAAPLRQPSRSATVPPRRPAPASNRRSPLVPGGSPSGPSRLVPALIGVGVLVLAVVALLVTGVIGGGDGDPSPAQNTAGTAMPGASATPAELTPASTKVAVLNGTTTAGLASREKDALSGAGFTQVATGNNTDQQRAESSVLFGTRPGARAQARAIAGELNIATVQRMDADTRDLSEDADVAVIVGGDKAP